MTPQEALEKILKEEVTENNLTVLFINHQVVESLSLEDKKKLMKTIRDFLMDQLGLLEPSCITPRVIGIAWKLFHDENYIKTLFEIEEEDEYDILKMLNDQIIATEEETCVITNLINSILVKSDVLPLCDLISQLRNKYEIISGTIRRRKHEEGFSGGGTRKVVRGRRQMEEMEEMEE